MTIPDTLDLADRAALALHALTGALDPDYGYELYFVVQFCRNPAVMIHEGTGLATNNPKFAEAQAMMRVMSGSDFNLDIQHAMMDCMLKNVHEDGLYYSPLERRPWSHEGSLAVGGIQPKPFANIYGNARFLLAMMAWSQWSPEPAWEGRMQRLAAALGRVAIDRKDYAYFPVNKGVGEIFSYTPDGWAETAEPDDGSFGVPMYYCAVIRALAGWYAMSGDREALTLAGKLSNFVRKPFVWTPPRSIPGIDGPQHGHGAGHFHAHAAALRGLLAYAIAVEDPNLMGFVRDGYEWLSTFGVRRVGWFPENMAPRQHCETCCIADMVPLAIRLSEIGMGDYWDDVDRFVRNQLVEQQLTRQDYLEQLSRQSPARPVRPPRETADRVIERNMGGFVGHGDLTTLPNTWIMHCCTGNGAPALYYAWDSILRFESSTAHVNLLLNRTSPWLDVSSSLPYQGKVVLRNKKAVRLFVRMPVWVARRHVQCHVGRHTVTPIWAGRSLLFEHLRSGDVVEVAFPIPEQKEKFVLDNQEYQAMFKGNTLVDIAPRVERPDYPIYMREHYRQNQVPVAARSHYVSAGIAWW